MGKKIILNFTSTTVQSKDRSKHCILAHVIGSSNTKNQNKKIIAIAYNVKTTRWLPIYSNASATGL